MARRKPKAGHLQKRGGKYYLQLDVDGVRRLRVIRDDKGNTFTSERAAEPWRDRTAQEIRESLKGSDKQIALGDFAETYREYLPTHNKSGRPHTEATRKTRLAPRTLRTNLRYIRDFSAWMAKHHPGARTLDAVTDVHAKGYMASHASGKESSYNRRLMALRHVFKVIPGVRNPFAAIEARKPTTVQADTDSKRPFTTGELATMQAKASGWIRPAMFTGYYTGLRLGDVVTLEWSAVEMEDGFLRTVTRKSSKPVVLYAPEIMPHLEEWRAQAVIDWNRDTIRNSRTVAETFKVSTGTAHAMLKRVADVPVTSEAEFRAFIRIMAQRALEAGQQAGRRRLESAIEGRLTIPLDPVPSALQGYVFPRQAAAYLGIERNRDTTAPTKEFQRFLRKDCGFTVTNDRGQALLGFHSLRAANATRGRQAGEDVEAIQRRLAHSTATTTSGYIQPTDTELRAELIREHTPLLFPTAVGSDQPGTEAARTRLRQLIDTLPAAKVEQLLSEVEG